MASKGNSSLVSDYAYTDQSPLSGVDYYRLKMTDLDGASTYSEVVVVRTGVVTSVSVFPNPAVSYVNITLASPATAGMSIRLINMSGQMVLNQQVSAGTSGTITLPVQSVTRGMYVVNIIASGALQQSTKLFINH
jgi:hypothetical protein